MANDSQPNCNFRWRWILPTLAFEVTLLLELSGRYERHPSEMGYTTLSWGVEGILNYPAAIVSSQLRFVDRIAGCFSESLGTTVAYAMSLGCVVLFWMWIGWAIDTKGKRRNKGSSAGHQLLWSSFVYAILFAFCIFIVWTSWRPIDVIAYSLTHENINPFEIWDFDCAVGAIWFVGGAFYFGKKVVTQLKLRFQE